jgi:uncharacterized cupredoxin-like copper-binding protein
MEQKSRPSITIAAIAVVIGVVTITLVMTAVAIVVPAVAQQSDNNSSATTVTPTENTIKVNATEKNEVYRWQINGQTNPDLRLTANTAYTFTVQNPTDTKHELIIADSQGKELATTGDLQPGSSGQLTFKPNMTSSSGGGNNMLGYHCEYHPDLMKGSIQIVNQ